MDALRMRGDPAVDAAVAAFAWSRTGGDQGVRALTRDVVAELQLPPRRRHPALRDFPLDGAQPAWAPSDETIREASLLFSTYGLHIATALYCASLPAAYAAANGAQVLVRGSDLASSHVGRRLAETGQMLIDVHASRDRAAFDPGGPALQSIAGVRVFHSVVRTALQAPGAPPWDADRFGVPINQEDLLGTLLTFTSVTYRSLERMGVRPGSTAIDAHREVWNLVGYHIGIDEALLPLDEGDDDQLMRIIGKRQHRASAEGEQLMQVLLAEMESNIPLGSRKLPRVLVRYLLDHEDVPDLLGVPRTPWWSRPLLSGVAQLETDALRWRLSRWILQWMSARISRHMIQHYVDRDLEGVPPFQVPPDLQQRWGVETAGPVRLVRTRGRRHVRLTLYKRSASQRRGPTTTHAAEDPG